MSDTRQPPPSGQDGQEVPPEEAAWPRRPRRLRGYLATGTNLSQRPAQGPPPVPPPGPGEPGNSPAGPESADAETAPGGTA